MYGHQRRPPRGQSCRCGCSSRAVVSSRWLVPVRHGPLLMVSVGYGHNANANWDGNEVVQRSGHNIVMVNFNYRVGLWGFLASERVREDGGLNTGLLDQRMLLKWVKMHIASVGFVVPVHPSLLWLTAGLVRRRSRPCCHPWRLGRRRLRGHAPGSLWRAQRQPLCRGHVAIQLFSCPALRRGARVPVRQGGEPNRV